MEKWYLIAFSSFLIPTDSRDVNIWFNDIGIGYSLYDCRREGLLISSLTPMIEGHLTTPLDHRGQTDPITVPDIFVLTGGVEIGLGCRSVLTVGGAVPLTGPRPFSGEGIVQFNYYF
jgi:hypothetical protein